MQRDTTCVILFLHRIQFKTDESKMSVQFCREYLFIVVFNLLAVVLDACKGELGVVRVYKKILFLAICISLQARNVMFLEDVC